MRLQIVAKVAGTLTICLAMAVTASAQYGGGTGSGATGSGMPNYNYGSGKAIGIGVGVAAGAAVGIALLVHHHHKAKSQASLIGCTQPASSGISLKSEEDGQTYLLLSNRQKVQPGERVELKGVLKNDRSGISAFRVSDVITDFGACSATVASTRVASLGS